MICPAGGDMIIRKLAKAIRDQDWWVVFVEFMIVVVGIFVGLRADEWNQERLEDHRAQRVLEDLKVDFEDISIVTDGLADYYETVIHDLQILNRSLESGSVRSDDEAGVKAAIAAGDTWGDPPPPSGTYRSMVSSGTLALVRNKELRLRLIEYDESIDNIALSDASLNNMLGHFAVAFKRHARMSGTYRLPKSTDLAFVDVELPTVVDVNIDEMLADPEFRVAAEQHLRFQIARLINVKVTQSKIEQIQTLIEGSLNSTSK